MSRNYQEHPELYPWVEPMTRLIEMEQDAGFGRFYAARLAEQEACICEWDEEARTPKRGCPTHAQEDSENDAFDDLIDDAMIEIESRPFDQTTSDCTHGEKP